MKHSPANRLIIVLAGLLFCGVAHATDTNDCSAPKTQADMNICSFQSYQKVDNELNVLYKDKLAWLQYPATKQRFVQAQKAWIAFRDSSCLYEVGPREESGTIWPLLQNGCMEALTKRRVAELKEYVACDEDGCPR
jgi:uncharacterized protein YecT (DUF1311 family)